MYKYDCEFQFPLCSCLLYLIVTVQLLQNNKQSPKGKFNQISGMYCSTPIVQVLWMEWSKSYFVSEDYVMAFLIIAKFTFFLTIIHISKLMNQQTWAKWNVNKQIYLRKYQIMFCDRNTIACTICIFSNEY